jgi:hypothetical protein
MAGRHGGAQGFLDEHLVGQVRRRRRDPSQGKVEPAVAQPAVLLVVGQFDHARLDQRVIPAKRGQRVHEQQW